MNVLSSWTGWLLHIHISAVFSQGVKVFSVVQFCEYVILGVLGTNFWLVFTRSAEIKIIAGTCSGYHEFVVDIDRK